MASTIKQQFPKKSGKPPMMKEPNHHILKWVEPNMHSAVKYVHINLRKDDFEPLLDQHCSVPLKMGETRGKTLANPRRNEIIQRAKFTPTLIPC